MKRREFITLLGGAAVAWPLGARAQQGERMRRIGVLMHLAWTTRKRRPVSRRLYKDSRNSAGPRAATCRSTTAGVRAKPTSFVKCRGIGPTWARCNCGQLTASTVRALQAGDSHFADRVHQRTDPVGAGYVASLARPGGNITGFVAVRIRHQREMVGIAQADRPDLKRVAVLRDPSLPASRNWARSRRQRRRWGGGHAARRARPGEIERAVATSRAANGGLILSSAE